MTTSCSTLESLSHQLHQAHRSAVNAELAARGLREVGHPMLLTILDSAEEGPCQFPAQRDLAELLHISPAAVANSLKSLEKFGYIHREPGPDARRNLVALTEKGRQAAEGCHQAFKSVADRMLDDFSDEERALILAFRQRMLNNLRNPKPQAKEEP